MTNALLAAKELAAPGVANVNVNGLPAVSFIVPPLRANAPVDA